MTFIRKTLIAIVLILITTTAAAQIKLPAVISDNMVLQQQTQAPIWGWADPAEKITVKAGWNKKAYKTTADKNGKWAVKIKTPKAGGPYDLTIAGENSVTIKNVLIGEVWVCSGQSNMQWSMGKAENGKEHIAAANKPNIRLFTVSRAIAGEPKDDCEGNWSQCTPKTVAQFSAVAYFFGKHLQDELDIPIGLINTSWGGTPAEAWTRKEILEKDKDLIPILQRHEQWVENLPNVKKAYPKELIKWKEKVKIAEEKGQKKPKKLRIPSERHQTSPSSLYNAMISPLIPFSIKGAIWYQGEGNVSRAYQYRKLFPAMITNWRKDWKQGDFPFYYVQIAPFNYGKNPSQELREAQRLTLSLKNTGMAVTMDIGIPKDIHPTNKLDVGKRLALWALAKNYGKKDIIYSGPLYKSMKRQGDKIRLYFNHTGSGLLAKDGPLNNFTIAAKDGRFKAAQAQIDGNTILVSSPEIKRPVAVRFAWSNAAQPNLFNKEGLPASSFRTDNWPAKTINEK